MEYYAIPKDVIEDKKLSRLDHEIYGALIKLSRNKGYCFAKSDYFALPLNASVASIQRGLKRFRATRIY